MFKSKTKQTKTAHGTVVEYHLNSLVVCQTALFSMRSAFFSFERRPFSVSKCALYHEVMLLTIAPYPPLLKHPRFPSFSVSFTEVYLTKRIPPFTSSPSTHSLPLPYRHFGDLNLSLRAPVVAELKFYCDAPTTRSIPEATGYFHAYRIPWCLSQVVAGRFLSKLRLEQIGVRHTYVRLPLALWRG